jgi:hypothetical protein
LGSEGHRDQKCWPLAKVVPQPLEPFVGSTANDAPAVMLLMLSATDAVLLSVAVRTERPFVV